MPQQLTFAHAATIDLKFVLFSDLDTALKAYAHVGAGQYGMDEDRVIEALAFQAKYLINIGTRRNCASGLTRYQIGRIAATAYRRFIIEKFKSDSLGYLPPPEGLSATVNVRELGSLGAYSIPRRSMGPATPTGWTMRIFLSRWAQELARRYAVDERIVSDHLLQVGIEYIDDNRLTLRTMTAQRQDEIVCACVMAVDTELHERLRQIEAEN